MAKEDEPKESEKIIQEDKNIEVSGNEMTGEKDIKKKGSGEETEPTKAKKKASPKEMKRSSQKQKEEEQEEIKHIVRIAGTDLAGKRSVLYALTGIKGINRRIAKILVVNSGIDPKTTIGYLEDSEIEKLQSSINNIISVIPSWMMNKQHDFITGENRHIFGTDVYLSLNEDLNTLKKTRSYRGLRHDRGLRVRGQRTRSTGRKGRTVGVTRASIGKGAQK